MVNVSRVVAAIGCLFLACGGAVSPPDAGLDPAVDAGPRDGGKSDAGRPTDAGFLDAGPVDAGVTDAGVSDAGVTDAGALDAGGRTDGGIAPDAGCSARTCQAGVSCGTLVNTCGQTLDCGGCMSSQVCGGGTPNVCGVCAAPTFTSGPLPNGALASSYTLQLFDSVHGYAVQSYTLTSGSLPAGVQLGAFGNVSGIPLEPGHFTVEVEVVDSCPSPHSVRHTFSIDIDIPGARATSVSNGFFFATASTTSGGALSWGINDDGQLGRQDGGQSGAFSDPRAVLGPGDAPLSGVVRVAAADATGFAVVAGGHVVAWGSNAHGELGDGLLTSRDRAAPVLVDGGAQLVDVVSVTSGMNHVLALLDGGTAVGWGNNDNGQLSTMNGPAHRVATPILLTNGTPMTGILALATTQTSSAALLSSGTVMHWGRVGSNSTSPPLPLTFSNATPVTGIVAIAGGGSHFLALTSAGGVLAWGDNGNGEFGNGQDHMYFQPVAEVLASAGVPLRGVSAIAANDQDSYAIVDGGVMSWGANGLQQLGDPQLSAQAGRSYPGPVRDRLGAPLTGVVSLSANRDTAFGLTDGGVVFGWGSNGLAQRAQGGGIFLPWADYVLLGN